MVQVFALLTIFLVNPSWAEVIDCSEAYGTPSFCEKVVCNEKFRTFLGTWRGAFQSFSSELSSFRPYENEVSYSPEECLKNIENEDTFIIGRQTDRYPEFQGQKARTESGLLITGADKNGKSFLRTFEGKRPINYKLIYQNRLAVLSIWEHTVPATPDSPEMRFTIIDGKDFSETLTHKRNVTVTLTIGPVENPVWENVVSFGSHRLLVDREDHHAKR